MTTRENPGSFRSSARRLTRAARLGAVIGVLAALAAPAAADSKAKPEARRSVTKAKSPARPAAPRSADALDRGLEKLIERASMGPVHLSVAIVDCESGDVLAGHNQRTALIPASNMKLLTSAAALLVLSKDFQFKTRIIRDGDRLIVIGGGDPAFGDPELLKDMKLSANGFLERLLEPVKAAGVKGIKEIVVDDRIFDRELIHPSWPTDQLHRWYCAEVTGLMFHTNILNVYPKPGPRPGPADMPAIDPSAPWIEIVNQVQTAATGSTKIGAFRENMPGAAADSGDLRIKVTGSIRAAPDVPIDVTLHNTPMVFARLLADHAQAAGIADSTPKFRIATPGERFESAANKGELVVVKTPISTVLRRCNTDSYNLYAEAMLKLLGHEVTGQPGSWGTGATVLRTQLGNRIGLEDGELIIADGSGMSRENRVSSLVMARWLASVSRTGVADTLIESLPAPGEGTLAKRFRDKKLASQVRAKSGFINGVQCLSGYVSIGARRVAFSVLVNNITGQTPGGRVKEFHEDVVDMIDDWLQREVGAPANAEPSLGG